MTDKGGTLRVPGREFSLTFGSSGLDSFRTPTFSPGMGGDGKGWLVGGVP